MTKPALSRRRLAANGAALLGLTGTAAGARSASPDAALIGHCAAWQVLEHRFLATDFDALPGTLADADARAEQHRLAAAQQLHTDPICASRPSTLAGFAALAGVIVTLDCDVLEMHAAQGSTVDGLMLALLKGLTGRA